MKLFKSTGLTVLLLAIGVACGLLLWLSLTRQAADEAPVGAGLELAEEAVKTRVRAETKRHVGGALGVATSQPAVAAKSAAGPSTPLRRFEGATVLHRKVLAKTGKAGRRRVSILRAEMKYPLIRLEERFTIDRESGEEGFEMTLAMVADHVIVKLRPGRTTADLEAAAGVHGAKIRRAMRLVPDLYLVEFPEAKIDTVPDGIVALMDDKETVAYAEPDYIVHPLGFPSEDLSPLWGLHNTGQDLGTADADIDAPEAWDVTTGSRSILVGVIDTGVDYNHPDLAGNMWTNPGETPGNGIDDDGNGYIDDTRGWDFYDNNNDPYDTEGHGTHVSGTIGATANDGGVAGVNWEVSLVSLRFLGPLGGYTSDAIDAVAYSTAIGCRLTNNSWGGGGFEQSLKDVIDAAGAANRLFIAAAGNDGRNNDVSLFYPASYDSANIVSVGASDRNDEEASFSNYGRTAVDLFAPGVSIYSTVPNNSYDTYDGTSMASPHVAGVVALLLAYHGVVPYTQTLNRLLGGVDPVAGLRKLCVTGGRLNAFRAYTGIPAVTNFLAPAEEGVARVALSWVNPTAASFQRVVIRRRTDQFPQDPNDGTAIYTGTGNNYLDAQVTVGQEYFYTAFADHGNEGFANPTQTSVVAGVLEDYFTEIFTELDFDLNGGTLSFVPNGSPSFYAARRQSAAAFPTDPSGGVALPLGDDDYALVMISGGETFPFYGTSYSGFYVGSNGYITFGRGDWWFIESLSDHFSYGPRISGLFDDFDPREGGTISVRQLSDRVAVTYEDLPEYRYWPDDPLTSSSFQRESFKCCG